MTSPEPHPWHVVFHRQAQKDSKLIARSALRTRAEAIIDQLRRDPFAPPYEKLSGELAGAYSRRINAQHRVVYDVFPRLREVRVYRMWTHYE